MNKEESIEGNEITDTRTDEIPEKGYFEDFIGKEHRDKSFIEQKFIALYKSRYLLKKIGTMEERRICGNKLKQMVKKGVKSL